MKSKNNKSIKKYYIILFLLLISLVFINFNWIKNDERPITSEDEVLLGTLVLLYSKNLHGLELYEGILGLSYPPFIPSLIYTSFKIFGHSDDSAFYVNLFFWPILVLSCFFLGKKLYNEKIGLLAAFIISTLPPIIIFSRTIYDQFILVSLIMLNLALFAYSDYFKNRVFSLLYGLSFGICLLTRYTSLPYIIVPPFFFIFFKFNIVKKLFSIKQSFKTKFKIEKQNIIIVIIKIIISLLIAYSIVFFIKSYLTNIFFIITTFFLILLLTLTEKSIINNFMDSLIIAFLVTSSWYINKLTFLVDTHLQRFIIYTSEKMLSTIGNIFYYLIFLISYQLGFLNFLIFVFVIIFLSIKYYKQRKIDEQDLLFYLIFLVPYTFYTFISLKNSTITTSLLIPVSFIMAKGILESPKIIKYIFLAVVIAGGLFYLMPLQSFNRTISIDLGVPLWVEQSFDTDIIQTQNINLFSKKEDISLHFSKDSRFYALKNHQQVKEISKVIYSVLTVQNHTKTNIFFLYYNDFYICPEVLNYYLILRNIYSSTYHFEENHSYDKLHIPKNLSYTQNQEDGFAWIYNLDFLIASTPYIKDDIYFISFSGNYYAIHSYLSNSEKFKKTFKLIYRSNISNIEIIELYQNRNFN